MCQKADSQIPESEYPQNNYTCCTVNKKTNTYVPHQLRYYISQHGPMLQQATTPEWMDIGLELLFECQLQLSLEVLNQ